MCCLTQFKFVSIYSFDIYSLLMSVLYYRLLTNDKDISMRAYGPKWSVRNQVEEEDIYVIGIVDNSVYCITHV